MLSQTTALFMWGLSLSFFAFQFVLRLWPGLTMPQLMMQFQIDATRFGLLAAFYYYGYAGMQIPVAILLEKYGAKKILSLFASLCGIAMLIFTFTQNFYIALLCRLLIGAGSAVGFLGVSKVISEWFSKDDYTKMVGYSFSFGLTGAIYGGKPVGLLITHHPWQQVSILLAILSFAIALLCGVFLKTNPLHQQQKELKLNQLKHILCLPQLWLLAIANLFMVGTLEGFADVWGVPYLMTAYNITKPDAAGFISFVFVGMLFGGPLLAQLSQRFGQFNIIILSGIGMSLLLLSLLMVQHYHPIFLSLVFFTLGLLCCYQVLVFSIGAALVETQYLSITIAFLNCINMLGGSFFHTLIGKIMDYSWTGGHELSGLKTYSLHDYYHALSVIPAAALVGAAIVKRLHYLYRSHLMTA